MNIRAFLSAVTFDTSDWQLIHDSMEEQRMVWVTPKNDQVSLNFFSLAPDLPANAPNIAAVRVCYEKLLGDAGKLVEIRVQELPEIRALRAIIKFPMQPRGMAYVGSWTLPFEALSYVVKVQCLEQGITGMREAMLLNRKLANSEDLNVDENGRFDRPNWNPDAEEFDAEFPTHPVSRARRVLKRLEQSLQISPALQKLPRFPLPEVEG